MDTTAISPTARIRAWAELVRLPLVFVVTADTLAGAIISGGRWRQFADVAALLAASAAFWAAAGAVGDCCSCKDDLIRRPLRPIPSRRIGRWHALSIGVVLLAAGATLAGAPGTLPSSQIALILVAAILLGRIMLRNAPVALLIEILYRPFNFLMGLVIIPLAASPANVELRIYLLLCVGLYAITLVLLEENAIHEYRSRMLAAIAAPAIVAGLGIAALPVLFGAAGPSWPGTIYVGLALACTSFRLAQACLAPSGTTVANALRAVALGSILLAAAATAFTHHRCANLFVVATLAPAGASMWYLNRKPTPVPTR